jgi:hypothetical protein
MGMEGSSCGLIQGTIPDRGKIFLFPTMSRLVLRPTQLPIQWVSGAISPRVKQQGQEADHSALSRAEVKNSGARPPLLHLSSWQSALSTWTTLPYPGICMKRLGKPQGPSEGIVSVLAKIQTGHFTNTSQKRQH